MQTIFCRSGIGRLAYIFYNISKTNNCEPRNALSLFQKIKYPFKINMIRAFLISTMLSCFAVRTIAQVEWAPIGAQWIYSEFYPGFSETEEYTVIGEAIIQGKTCRVIEKESAINYTYEEDDKVWFFFPQDDSFHLLYDFSAQPGDEWDVSAFLPENDSAKIIVDAVSNIILNSIALKVLQIRLIADEECIRNLELVEGIGSRWRMFPRNPCASIDVYEELSCFQSIQLDTVPLTTVPAFSCWGISPVDFEPTFDLSLRIYPNPVADLLNVWLHHSISRSEGITLRILSAEGRVVHEFQPDYLTANFVLPVMDWQPGVYFLQYLEKDKIPVSIQFVKQ